MKRLVVGFFLLAVPAMAQTPDVSIYSRVIGMIDEAYPQAFINCRDVSQWSKPGRCNIMIGRFSGSEATDDAAGNILLGDDTHLPSPDAVGFVNIRNIYCGWRGDTPDKFVRISCPEIK